MAVIKCKMCGGDLILIEGSSTARCEFCDTVQTVPKADDDKKLTLFARANRLRAACEFDKAAGVYEAIVADFPEEAEAYWGLVLCRYGIEYVDDPATGKKIPTCHRSSFDSIMEDGDFEQVLENADSAARKVYREEAKQIEEIRKGIIAVSANEEPYDIFICYKETAENGDRTLDSVLAQDVYDALTDKGYRVFFSRITLEDKLGVEYEPYIFAALNSAKVMLVFGADYEYFNAVWVRNEWSRYLELMSKDKTKHLIPCFKGIDAYDMPKEFARLQAQDLGKVGAMQDLLRGIEKILPAPKAEKVVQETIVREAAAVNQTEPLLKRVALFLNDGEWNRADEYCEKVLDIDPECAEAYLGKLMAELRLNSKDMLSACAETLTDRGNFKKALMFAKEPLKSELQELLDKENYLKNLLAEGFEIKGQTLTAYTGKSADLVIPEGIVTIAEHVFYDHTEITSVKLPGSLRDIRDFAFYGCEKLTSIEIPGGVKMIGDEAFAYCEGLKSIVLPDTLKSLGNSAFFRCDPEEIAIPDGLVEIGQSAFGGCMRLKDIRISADHPKYRVQNNCIIDYRAKTLVFANSMSEIPDDGSVTSIGDGAFCGMDDVVSVSIPGCVNEIGTFAFSGTGLKTIDLPDGITNIPRCAFSECVHLTEIKIPETVGVIDERAFWYCTKMESVLIPEGVFQIKKDAFLECESLKSVIFTNPDVGIFNDAFAECEQLTIYAPRGSFVEQWAKKNSVPVKEEESSKKAREEELRKVRERFAPYRKRIEAVQRGLIAIGEYHAAAVKVDGTVVTVGKNESNRCSVEGWQDIVSVAAGGLHTVGLKSDGTVVATKHPGNFGSYNDKKNNKYFGQCDVEKWENITAIAAGDRHTVGLKSDGTVVATGFIGERTDNYGQSYVGEWKDIVAIAVNDYGTVGLKSDGTVVATTGGGRPGSEKMSEWQNIVAIDTERLHTVGLKEDGTVVAAGLSNTYGAYDIDEWEDIIAIAAGEYHTVGLKSDGTVVATEWKGNPKYYSGQCDVSDWTDVVAIAAAGSYTLALRADGRILIAGDTYNAFNAAAQWKLFNNVDTLEQERIEAKEAKIAADRRASGLCQHCGGELKGFFTKKCVVCGKPKDY